MASPLPRLFSRHLLFYAPSCLRPSLPRSLTFPTTSISSASGPISDAELGVNENPDNTDTNTQEHPQQRLNFERALENGLDQGVYKAIMVGKVGQKPVQKRLKSGRLVTMFSLGTGGIRNNRRPLEDEDPKEYANRCAVQWHRVAVYPEGLSLLAMKHVKPGSTIYLEGNLETKVFSDPISGLVRRIREIAIRRDGRFVFLGHGNDDDDQADLRRVGYF